MRVYGSIVARDFQSRDSFRPPTENRGRASHRTLRVANSSNTKVSVQACGRSIAIPKVVHIGSIR